MRDISARVQFSGGTTELMITPRIADPSRPAIVKRLRVSTPYSSTVWTRAVVRRQFAMSSSSRKTPRTVFVLPTSTVSSISGLLCLTLFFCCAGCFFRNHDDGSIECHVAGDHCHDSDAIPVNAQETFRTQTICRPAKGFHPICHATALALSEARHRLEAADHIRGTLGNEM